VGEISETAEGGTEFRFLKDYFELVPRPVLGQRFEDDLERVRRSRARERLPDFFANLIPEGRLRELIEQTTPVEAGDDLALLAYVGGDLPGAGVVRPFEGEELVSQERRGDRSGEVSEEPAPEEEVGSGLRFSLAGVQLKLSMLREGEKLTVPVRDQAGNWIAKFDSPSFPHLPANEYSMMEWARAAGFDVPECHLHGLGDLDETVELLGVVRRLVLEGTRVLAVRRYDRTNGGRIHQEDFAQVVGLPPAKKYEQVRHEDIALLVRRFIDEGAVDEYARRLVLTVAIGNGDAHLKNWSLIYPDGRTAELAPAYDFVSTVPYLPDDRMALNLGGTQDFGEVSLDRFRRFAARSGVPERLVVEAARETAGRLMEAWAHDEVVGRLPEALRARTASHMRSVPLSREQ
jgi:serine/threonine-protein kinase HipA